MLLFGAKVWFNHPVSPRSTAVESIQVTFTEAVTGFDLADLRLTDSYGRNQLTGSETLTTADNIAWTLGNLSAATNPAGRVATLTLTLRADGSGIVNRAYSAPLRDDAVLTFTVVDPALVRTGRTLTLTGTAGDDRFGFAADNPASASVNGVTYTIDPTAVSTVVFRASGGADTASLVGSSARDLFVSVPGAGYAYLAGSGITGWVYGAQSVIAYGGGNTDQAVLYDTAANDRFVSSPAGNYAYLYGGGYLAEPIGFRSVIARATRGGTDVAYLYDTAANDVYVGRPTYSTLAGGGWSAQSVGFDAAYAYATAGGGGQRLLLRLGRERRVRRVAGL